MYSGASEKLPITPERKTDSVVRRTKLAQVAIHSPSETGQEQPSMEARSQAIRSIVCQYQNHEDVLSFASNYMKQPGGPVELPSGFSYTSDSVLDQTFRRNVGHYRLLKATDEKFLFRTIERGLKTFSALEGKQPTAEQKDDFIALTAAHQVIAAANLRLVIDVACRYAPKKATLGDESLALQDLVDEGSIGLIRAIEGFDIKKGYKFSTYATDWIEQAIQRGNASTARSIRLPRRTQNDLRAVKKVEKTLTAALEREPTVEELSRATGFSIEKLNEYEWLAQKPKSLNAKSSLEGTTSETEVGDMVKDSSIEDIIVENDQQAFYKRRVEELIHAANLTESEELVTRLLSSLDNNPDHLYETAEGQKTYRQLADQLSVAANTYETLGRLLGITTRKVVDIEKKAFAKIQNHATPWQIPDHVKRARQEYIRKLEGTLSPTERDNIINTVRKMYEADPKLQLLEKEYIQAKDVQHKPGNLSNQARRYGAIDNDAVRTLVHNKIETGLATYQDVVDFRHITAHQKQALLEMLAAHRAINYSSMRLVPRIARELAKVGLLSVEDLIQEGHIGLSKAVSGFRVRRGKGNTFSTYATQTIKQEMLRAIANQGRTIRIPRHAQGPVLEVLKEEKALTETLNRAPSSEELATNLGMTTEKVDDLLMARPLLPYNEPGDIEEAESQPLVPQIDHLQESFTRIALQQAFRAITNGVDMNNREVAMSKREKLILCLHHGIDPDLVGELTYETPFGTKSYSQILKELSPAGEPISLSMIAKELGFKSVQVVQYAEVNAFSKIGTALKQNDA